MVQVEAFSPSRFLIEMPMFNVQVFSASAMAFAHGANDVANVRILCLSHNDMCIAFHCQSDCMTNFYVPNDG